MCLNVPCLSLIVVGVGVLMSVVMFYPSPPLSPQVLGWQKQGKFFSYKGHNIFYRDMSGKGSKGTVMCLHGFPTFSWDWSKILPGLQTQYSRVILFDFLGFGLSDKPESHNYSLFEQADIAESLAASLAVTKTHLLSHDYGDTVAQELLHRHNQVVQGKGKASALPTLTLQSLVLLNGGIFPEGHKPRILQKLLLVPVLGPILGRLTFFRLFKRGFGEIFGENQPSEAEFLDFYATLCHKNGHHVTSGLLSYIPERHANRDRWVNALKEAKIPVLMIYGPADPVNPPAFADHFRKELPQHKLAILDKTIGHYPHLEDSGSTLYHIAQFLQTIA
ncbi:mesoderm-specific transcript protein-like isoform X1 [Littorina saxatilis]|uniref:AB hydrolase-1 domain-containing protein n=1 Tax=Littorina saxatilis TaxID=31220 RepID=A0AAN9BCH2_9CAEN